MGAFDGNYECEGQMSIFDFLQQDKEHEDKPVEINDYWHETCSKLPENKDWMKALFVIHNPATGEFHYNMPGEVKDKTFRRPPDSPEGNVIAWKYCEG
ncbi:MAG: hypothetical protein J6Y02_21255 [Pseudobutyrivibrio sp.]|nr:hypothetical protein [Pseudobutyrivibrio sp.]